MREVAPIQALQAQPPRVVLARAWWGEPLRRLLGVLVGLPGVPSLALPRVRDFLHGVTRVELRV